jgi:hypothetical protein
MTSEELNLIKEIEGTGGFRVMKYLIEQKMDKLESVMSINKDGLVAEQTLGRQLAFEVLSEFLKELNLLPSGEKEKRKTYE